MYYTTDRMSTLIAFALFWAAFYLLMVIAHNRGEL